MATSNSDHDVLRPMQNLCSYRIDTDLHTELLQSFKDMVLQPCAIHLANPLFMRMSWLGYLIFLIQVSPTSGSTSMKALIPIIPLTWPDLTFVLVMLLSASPMHGSATILNSSLTVKYFAECVQVCAMYLRMHVTHGNSQ